jgi:hypothetical protein
MYIQFFAMLLCESGKRRPECPDSSAIGAVDDEVRSFPLMILWLRVHDEAQKLQLRAQTAPARILIMRRCNSNETSAARWQRLYICTASKRGFKNEG